jgi:DNA-binding NarL/FixJ family response regulator
MSEALKAVTLDGATGQVTERELTAEEIADNAQFQTEYEAQIAEREAKAAARESALAKLAELGLTAEEIAAL